MNRSIINTFALVAMSILAAPGCGVVEGDEWVVPAVQEISLERSERFRLCREMATTLRGQEATGWTVIDYDRLVALTFGGRVQCLDAVEEVRRVGIIPVDGNGSEDCRFCGTPLPAEELIEAPEDDFVPSKKME